MSADGMQLVATTNFGDIYSSDDGGATWTETLHVENYTRWSKAVVTADGTKMIAASYWQLYSSVDN
jgi:photosystem II stability/assembly factor-like uncharacterized protein